MSENDDSESTAPVDPPKQTPTDQEEAIRAAARAVIRSIIPMPAPHLTAHPLVAKQAKLPTAAIKRVVAMAVSNGIRHRNATTWWAHPVTGKTFCIKVLVASLAAQFPDSGIFVFEPDPTDDEKQEKSPLRTRESRELEFLNSLLIALDFTGRKDSGISGRRMQVARALLALALPSRHLFVIFDEVQGMDNERYLSFKKITNWLENEHDIHLNIISFGQFELKGKRAKIQSGFLSDIEERFIGDLYEFFGIRSEDDAKIPLAACDSASEFPALSGLTYTAYLLPKAHAAGFELESAAKPLFDAFMAASKVRRGESGVAMQYFAGALSELVLILAQRDAPDLKVTAEDCKRAVAATRWARRSPVRTENKGKGV